MINVSEIMNGTAEVTMPKKTNTYNAVHRLNTIANMIESLERNVESADVGVGQNWRDAYDNLYKALQICKNVEKDLI